MKEKNKKRVVVILQARMGASRLPGKPLKKVLDRPLLSYQIERLRRAKLVDEIVIATTTEPQDDQIETFCKSENITHFRGSTLDVLDRYYQAAKAFQADVVVRVTGDCPLIDPKVVDQVIGYYLDHLPTYQYVSNSLERTFPRGLDTEIFSYDLLERAAKEANLPPEREHVTLYFYTHPEKFSLGNVKHSADLSDHRWTVDTTEDLELITKILEEMYPRKHNFNMEDVLKVLDCHPDWSKINSHIKQKSITG
jgi:spore coat polysaccharide biosynthesis protein SpsF